MATRTPELTTKPRFVRKMGIVGEVIRSKVSSTSLLGKRNPGANSSKFEQTAERCSEIPRLGVIPLLQKKAADHLDDTAKHCTKYFDRNKQCRY